MSSSVTQWKGSDFEESKILELDEWAVSTPIGWTVFVHVEWVAPGLVHRHVRTCKMNAKT